MTRPIGYVLGAVVVVPFGLYWQSQRMLWLAGCMMVLASVSLLGRRRGGSEWVAGLLLIDAAWTAAVIAILGVHPLAASLLFAGHAVTGYLTLTPRWARGITAFISVLVGALLVLDLPAPPEMTTGRVLAAEVVMACFGLGAILADFELIVRALHQSAEQRASDLARATEVAEHRAEALRSVSHDVRTPLTSIGGFAHFLADPDLPELDRVEFARRISTEAAHLTHLVDDLLASARLDAGQLVMNVGPVPVFASTKDVVEVFRPRGLDVRLEVDPEHTARADVARFEQILRNLLSNAEKYGGSAARITSRRDGDVVVVSVCDHGPGVPEGERERIFMDFAQSGEASHLTGTGLGLGISRRLAHAMGGDLRCVDSNTGACFELLLPAFA